MKYTFYIIIAIIFVSTIFSCKVFKEGSTTIEQAQRKVNSTPDSKFELMYTVKDKQNRNYYVYRQFKSGTSVVAVGGQNLTYKSTIYRIFDHNRIYLKSTRSDSELKSIVSDIEKTY